MRKLGLLLAVVSGIEFLLGAADALAQGGVDGVSPPPIVAEKPIGIAPPPSEIQPIVDFVPIFGNKMRDRGVDLPLPFGLGVSYTYINQNTEVYDLRVEGNPLDVNILDSKTSSHTLTFRADVWLLPVLNVYGLFGYTSGETKPKIRLRDGTTISSSVDYSRAMYGGGATAAAGYRAFFVTLDANYTTGAIQADNGQIGDRDLYSIIFTPRVGANFSAGFLGEGALWVGAMYMDFAQEVRDVVHLGDIDPRLPILVGQDELDYTIRIKAKDPWNVLFGGSWVLNKRWSIAIELGGILDRFQSTAAVMFRF